MKLGLIGNPLSHSWSPEIHRFIINEPYELWPLSEDQLDLFFAEKNFSGINVTIPYKQKVLDYLDEIDEKAYKIGAVNCIINQEGKLKGYNTDYLGLLNMLRRYEVDPEERKAAILGSGGAAKAAMEAMKELGFAYVTVSRSGKSPYISYDELYAMTDEISIIINATPLGMYPNTDQMPLDLNRFSNLKWIIDIIANPIRTKLQFKGKLKDIRTIGGLRMLVSQAYEADKLFTGKDLDPALIDECLRQLYLAKGNIVLIGMPTSGKSSIGRILSKKLDKEFCDMDELFVERNKMPIRTYFEKYGEKNFREEETRIAKEVSQKTGVIIATGGGVILNEVNMQALSANGFIIWLDRDLSLLEASADRPLSDNLKDLSRLYENRKELYNKYCDIRIANNETREKTCELITCALGKDIL